MKLFHFLTNDEAEGDTLALVWAKDEAEARRMAKHHTGTSVYTDGTPIHVECVSLETDPSVLYANFTLSDDLSKEPV